MGLTIVKGDLFEQEVDAVVVPSQPSLVLEGAVGGKAKEICGERLEMELAQCKPVSFGGCVIVNSYADAFKRVIVVANPRYIKGTEKEIDLLKESYENCVNKAGDFGLTSVAFPLLSTGAYKFNKKEAIVAAFEGIGYALEEYPDMDVRLVVHDESIYKNYKDLFKQYPIQSGSLYGKEQPSTAEKHRQRFAWYDETTVKLINDTETEKTFAELLKYFMVSKHLNKADCYESIVSATMFYKYLGGEVTPEKYTAVAIGINMGLSVDELNLLLAPLGASLLPSQKRDAIIIKAMEEQDHTIDSINDELPPEWKLKSGD